MLGSRMAESPPQLVFVDLRLTWLGKIQGNGNFSSMGEPFNLEIPKYAGKESISH
jgi:hypothetical protein